LRKLEGSPEKAIMAYSLRDHDASLLTARKKTLEHAAKRLNEQYGAQTVTLSISDRYRNMFE
jgi:tripeptide aminopeptidase